MIIIFCFSFNYLKANPNLDVKTAILIDYDSDEIIYELESDMSIYPASMTKIMTSIVVFDLLKDNKLNLDDKFIISEKAWRLSQSGYSSMFLMPNDEVSVDDLLKGNYNCIRKRCLCCNSGRNCWFRGKFRRNNE